MSAFRHFVLSLIVAIVFIPFASAEECYIAEDMGTSYQVIVKANPSGLRTDSGYQDGTLSQRADWVDSGLFTDGSPFYFEIEGSWTPWYGNTLNKTDANGKSVTLLADESQYCMLATVNPDSEVIGKKGEFDYITSAYDVLRDKDGKYKVGSDGGYSKVSFDPYKQKPCWLNAGEGLYIAFFGKSGLELPEIATHLKTGIITCDEEYAKDKNGDGILTIDECYKIGDPTKRNMAYYRSYISGRLHGTVSCKKEFFHGKDINRIGLTECYEDVKMSDGTTQRVDRTKFTFSAPNGLYKKTDRSIARSGENIKFMIYDTYYRDNVGQYIINIYGGVSDKVDRGLIERILGDMESVFVGKRDESGRTDGGILMQFYNYIIKDTTFAWIVRATVILYMTFLGLQFAMGSLEYKDKELFTILLKLTFVLSFTTVTSWDMYDRFVVKFFVDGFSSIIVMVANVAHKVFEPEALPLPLDGSLSSKFVFIDDMVIFLFSDSITRKIQGLFFGVWFGFIVIPIFYILVIYYVYQLVNAIFPYIIMFVQAVLALALGPIFISFYLFKTTEGMFKNWLAFVGARFANMAFLFLFLFSFASIIKQQFRDLLHFEVCKVSLLKAITGSDGGLVGRALDFFSFGIRVWDARWSDSYPKPTFIGMCINLLFIGVLIYLFGIIMKKVPTIVDSMISIGGESGGGLNKEGNSKLGSKSGSSGFADAINSSIKVTGDNGKDVGILDKIGSTARALTGKGAKTAGSALWKRTGGAAANAIKDAHAKSEAKYNAAINGLKGRDAVNAAVKNYEESLKGRGLDKFEMEDKVNAFRREAEKDFVKKPLDAEMKKIASDLNAVSKSKNLRLNSKAIKELTRKRVNDFMEKELGGNLDGRYNSYTENSPLMFMGDETAKDLKDYQMESMRRALEAKALEEQQKAMKSANHEKYEKHEKAAADDNIKASGRNKKVSEEERAKLLKDKEKAMEDQANSMRKEYELSLAEAKRINEEFERLQKVDLDRKINTLEKLKDKVPSVKDCLDKLKEAKESGIKEEKYDDLMKEFNEIKEELKQEGLKMEEGEEERKTSVEYNKELDQLNTDVKDLQESMAALQNEVAASGNSNLALEGIDGDKFGVQGIKGVGLGEDVEDVLGFGKGAGATVLASEFESGSSNEEKVDQGAVTVMKTRLKMAKQQDKILQFQLAQAEASGDQSSIDSIKEQLKDNKKQIKSMQNNIGE